MRKVIAIAALLALIVCEAPRIDAQTAIVLPSCSYSVDPSTGEAETACNAEYGNAVTTTNGLIAGGSNVANYSNVAPFSWATVYTCSAAACGAVSGVALLTSILNNGSVTEGVAQSLVLGCTTALGGCILSESLRANQNWLRQIGESGGDANACYDNFNAHQWLDDPYGACYANGLE